ncbi:MAG TPA: copper-containing nitrite reductase [Steroidobacteraceae bacterium]|nr:copper-containing nitrite reductase [Steroidobacteraceae bacterium]
MRASLAIVRTLVVMLIVVESCMAAGQPTRHATAGPQAETPSATEVAAGHKVFRICQACHSLQPGQTLVGPSLAGLIGRQSGSLPGFDYSPAMKQARIIWEPRTLEAYLADPQKVVPGNRMPFAGLQSALDRRDVIAFLESVARSGGGANMTGAAALPSNAPAQPSSRREEQGRRHSMPDMPDVRYTLRTGISEGRMVFLGVGGPIDGKVNPVLSAAQGQIVEITLINGEGAEHDIVLPDQDVHSARVVGKGASTTVAFLVNRTGDFFYYCSVPGHRLAGMEGHFIVSPRPPAQTLAEADISRDPTDLPAPITRREPQLVRVDLIAEEVSGRLAEGSTYLYWTFNGRVPGPFIRVRVGDTVEVHLRNSGTSTMVHSVDFHAVIGPGGGASVMQVDPGKERTFRFKALVPGLFVYHCATPMVAEHIANGMYGLILVEPPGGLPRVDREFYIMQGEIYTEAPFGRQGAQEFSVEKLLDEHPEYFVFNGSVGALSKLHPLHAKVGDTLRIFFGDGGPDFTSSFHVIGEIFDRVYPYGSLLSPPLRGIQTVSVPPGGAVIAEFQTHVPGAYSIVDHALSRSERGLGGILYVEGAENPDIFH